MTRNHDGNLTSIIKDDDTGTMKFGVGSHVRCIMGALKGIQGEVVATRSGGRLLIRKAKGVYIEVPRICVERVNIPSG